MHRYFIWSDGVHLGEPWISVVNHSALPMRAEFKLRLDGTSTVLEWGVSIDPWTRYSHFLRAKVGTSNFWISVRLDQFGAATLTSWRSDYSLPPYTPPPTIIVEDGETQQLRIKTTIEPK